MAEAKAAWDARKAAEERGQTAVVRALKLEPMNGRTISFPVQVHVYCTTECDDAIVYRLSNALGVSAQNARKYLKQLMGPQSDITIESGIMRLHS